MTGPLMTGVSHPVRSIRAFFKLPGMRGFAVVLVGFLLMVGLATAFFYLRYEIPGEGRRLDLAESVYAVFSLMFFGSGYPWPEDAVTRVLFFLVPLTGIAVLGQTLVGLMSALVNRERWDIAVASTLSDHVIVCGLSHVGVRVLEWLGHMGEQVVVIEQDGALAEVDEARAKRIPVIIGDARRANVLQEANLMTAESIVTCARNELINLSIATAARALRPDMKVIVRAFDENLAANLKTGFDIHFAYSTSALAAPAFAAAATRTPVDYAFTVGDDKLLVTVTEFTVVPESPLVGYTLGQLEDEYDVEVIAVETPEIELNPGRDRTLAAGDQFVVSGTLETINRVAALVPSTREMHRYHQGRWKGPSGR